MNSNSCGKGFVVFSLTFVLGLSVSDGFVPDKQILQKPSQRKAAEKVTIFEPPKPDNCFPEFNKLVELREERRKHPDLAKLRIQLRKLKQLELDAIGKQSFREIHGIVEKIDEISEDIKFKKQTYKRENELKSNKNFGFDIEDLSENRRLLYIERCYENKF